jgi:hypothetical protein
VYFCIAGTSHTRITSIQLLATEYIDIMLRLNAKLSKDMYPFESRIFYLNHGLFIRKNYELSTGNSMYQSRFVFMSDLKISSVYIVRLAFFRSGFHEERRKLPGHPNISNQSDAWQ